MTALEASNVAFLKSSAVSSYKHAIRIVEDWPKLKETCKTESSLSLFWLLFQHSNNLGTEFISEHKQPYASVLHGYGFIFRSSMVPIQT